MGSNRWRWPIFFIVMITAVTLGTGQAAEVKTEEVVTGVDVVVVDKYIRTADNFIILYDASGSMARPYEGTGMTMIEAAEKVLEMENQGATLDELIVHISGKVGQQAWVSGDLDGATIACGQNVGLIHEVLTVKQVIDNIVGGAREIAARLGTMVQ